MKKYRLLIGYDGSACAEEALRDLARAGLPARIEALILRATDVFLPVGSDLTDRQQPNWLTESLRQVRAEAREAVDQAYASALEACQRLQKMFPTWTVRAEATADQPAWALVKKADDWKPNLVLLGCHRRFALERFFLGSVSQKVLTHVPCSVRIVRREPRKRTFAPRLLIGFDGSTHSRRAVQEVAGRSWPQGTVVRLVCAFDLSVRAREGYESLFRDHAIRPAMEELEAAGLAVQVRIRKSEPREALRQEVKRWKPDCLFLGARGLSAVSRFLLGSVSSALAAQAPCPIEVVR